MDPLSLPQITEWVAGGATFEPRSFIRANSTIAEAVALSMIAWPTLVKYRDGVFLEMAFDREVIDDWFARLDGPGSVESMVNHVHVWDLFAVSGDSEDDAAAYLASVIAETWLVAAGKQFPEISFDVVVTNAAEEYGPTVTLISTPPKPEQPS